MYKSFLHLILLVFACAGVVPCKAQFRVVGYIHPRWNEIPDMGNISFSSLSHLNIAFINPDSTGNFVLPAATELLVRRGHQDRVKVLASLGGGSFNPFMAARIQDSGRKAFVEQLIRLVNDYKFDGIDVDLEGDAIDSSYDAFIADLSMALKHNGKLMTAAFATWNATVIPTPALRRFDFINVMSYDQTGPWRPNEPGPHSTYQKAEDDLRYWTVTRGLSKNKLNLGVPFYGYCFATRYGASMSYADIIHNFPGADSVDVITPDGGGVIHYNGLPTIQSKTRLALKAAGGIMIWQILQDATGEQSLLKAINDLRKTKPR